MVKKINSDSTKLDDVFDRKISFVIMTPFVALSLQFFILTLFAGVEEISKIPFIIKAVVGIAYLYALPIVFKRSSHTFFISYAITIFIFLFNYLIFPDNQKYSFELAFYILCMCLPSFIYSMSILDLKILMEYMKKAGNFIFVLLTVLGVLIFNGKVSIDTYSMSLSYYMLFPAILYLNDIMDHISVKKSILFAISFFLILILGARGPLVCMAVFILLKLKKLKLTKCNVIVFTIIFNVMILMLLFYNSILKFISLFLLRYGISSRTINLLMKQNIFMSGREVIYNTMNEIIMDHPILGIGIGGDRLILGGGYAHNIILEVLSDFGVIVGLVLLIMLFFLIIKNLMLKDLYYDLFIILISVGFVHLFISSSYLIDINFWVFLGVTIRLNMQRTHGKEAISEVT